VIRRGNGFVTNIGFSRIGRWRPRIQERRPGVLSLHRESPLRRMTVFREAVEFNVLVKLI